MPTLTECMESIRGLVKEKGHGDTLEDFSNKLLFAFVELGEATDIWKKHGLNPTEFKHQVISPTNIYYPSEEIAEELIDVIFYILDAYGLLCRELNIKDPDEMFLQKLNKNFKRSYRYGRNDTK